MGVHQCGHRIDFAEGCSAADVKQFVSTLCHVDMGVLLYCDDHVGLANHGIGQVAMKIELDPYYGVRCNRSRMGDEIPFAVVVAVSHHGPVQCQQDHVQRGDGLRSA